MSAGAPGPGPPTARHNARGLGGQRVVTLLGDVARLVLVLLVTVGPGPVQDVAVAT